MKQKLTQEYLKDHFFYNADTGDLFWRKKTSVFSKIAVGDVAGCTAKDGRKAVTVLNKRHYIHRIIFLYMYGFCPKQIDHINHNPSDNRLANLRPASPSVNQRNRSLNKNNTSGFNGVRMRRGRWLAQVKINNKVIDLGSYIRKADAITARKEANEKYNFHKNHGASNG